MDSEYSEDSCVHTIRDMAISRKNIQQVLSVKESSNDNEEKKLVRKVTSMIKRISLIHSTEQAKEDLQVGGEKKSVFSIEVYKGNKILYVGNLILATSKKC